MHHRLRPVDLAVGLGSHDLGVATCTAQLYRRGLFPTIVFTGANAPTTVERFPRGEAVHYREHALELGVPDAAILVEPSATNTGENIDRTRDLVRARGLDVSSVLLVTRPYQQRRAYAQCRMRWPEVDVVCASQEVSLDDYVAGIGDPDRVVDMLVGDTQRVWLHAERGWAVPQDVPAAVTAAYDRLVAAGYTRRVVEEGRE
ncbi:YdcF family protein [Pseudonocardia phyllosphaerae]|uniref:YdcF family protein n=1 Tax=Pseudonocardia phyllosphaerae TaxID=3390502 RepID=UPI00397C82CB